mgnify:CR=1 FL=1
MNAALRLIISIAGMVLITYFATGTIKELQEKNRELRDEIRQMNVAFKMNTYIVTATMYEAKREQTDATPHITADGTRINTRHASKYRYVAVSRNLLTTKGGPLNYGDYIIVEGISGKYDGVWQVKDTMHSRWVDRIDLLCSPGTRPFKKQNVTIKIFDT